MQPVKKDAFVATDFFSWSIVLPPKIQLRFGVRWLF
jgi:hypothetical protein